MTAARLALILIALGGCDAVFAPFVGDNPRDCTTSGCADGLRCDARTHLCAAPNADASAAPQDAGGPDGSDRSDASACTDHTCALVTVKVNGQGSVRIDTGNMSVSCITNCGYTFPLGTTLKMMATSQPANCPVLWVVEACPPAQGCFLRQSSISRMISLTVDDPYRVQVNFNPCALAPPAAE